MKTAKKATSKNRRPGRPKAASRITPAEKAQMAKMFLRGASFAQIAEHIGCHKSTVQKHVKETAIPAWRESMKRDLAIDLAELAELEQIAWEELDKCRATAEATETVKQALGAKGRLRIAERVSRTIGGRGAIAWAALLKSLIEFRCRIRGDLQPDRLSGDTDVIPAVEVVVSDRSELEQPIPYARFQEMLVKN